MTIHIDGWLVVIGRRPGQIQPIRAIVQPRDVEVTGEDIIDRPVVST